MIEQVWHEADSVDLGSSDDVEQLAATLAAHNRGTEWLLSFLDWYRQDTGDREELIDRLLFPTRINDPDWECAFSFASGISLGYCEESAVPMVVRGAGCSSLPFNRVDVKRVVAAEDGEKDEDCWEGVFELWDGRFAFLSAGCDYTGWD